MPGREGNPETCGISSLDHPYEEEYNDGVK
jgi:hypothetical protein